jgi:hypothetical protein
MQGLQQTQSGKVKSVAAKMPFSRYAAMFNRSFAAVSRLTVVSISMPKVNSFAFMGLFLFVMCCYLRHAPLRNV